MKIFSKIIKKFYSTIFVEYLPMFLVVSAFFIGAFYFKEGYRFLYPANKVTAVHEEVILYGKVYSHMTYGRRVFENLDERSEYKYFIVEPHDYTKNGTDKYSPTTRSLTGNEMVKITGEIVDYCWWDNGVAGTEGCVPWVEANNMVITVNLTESNI